MSIHNTSEYLKLFDTYTVDGKNYTKLSDISLDSFLRYTQPYHNNKKSITNQIFGFNHRGVNTAMQHDRDNVGYTFFTRPQLCMVDYNLAKNRQFAQLLTNDRTSPYRYVRGLLDPRLGSGATNKHNAPGEVNVSAIGPEAVHPALDNSNMFVVPFTNFITSCSGWPDPVIPTYTSKPDVRGGVWGLVDGSMDINNDFDINCTFTNARTGIINWIVYYWAAYAPLVFDGVFTPYIDMIAANEIDYNTRIYRMVTDETKTFLKYIACTGASFITNIDMGKLFNFNQGDVALTNNREVSVNFKSIGAFYNDPITIDEFNKTVGYANENMRIIRLEKLYGSISGKTNYIKVPKALLDLLNYRGYPMIDYETNEIEWFLDKNSPSFKNVLEFIKLRK